MKFLRLCLDPRVLLTIALGGVAVVIIAPELVAATIPLLVVAACPLSMVLMMRSMGNTSSVPNPAPGFDRTTDLRRELDELMERQRRLEAELVAAQHTSPSEGISSLASADRAK